MHENGTDSPTRESAGTSENLIDRDDIIERHMNLVWKIANETHKYLPLSIDGKSLFHSGVVGLLEAANTFDSTRGVPLGAFAKRRINGEIVDYLRTLDIAPQKVRQWGRKITKIEYSLSQKLKRLPTSEEKAQEFGVDLATYFKIEQEIHDAEVISLQDYRAGGLDNHNFEGGKNTTTPEMLVEAKDLVEKLITAIEGLPERQRSVLTRYYNEGLPFREIGDIFGVTEGGAFKIHKTAILRLRAILLPDQHTSFNGYSATKLQAWFKNGSEGETLIRKLYERATEDERGFRIIKNPSRCIREEGKTYMQASALIQSLKKKGALLVINSLSRRGFHYIFLKPQERASFDKSNFHKNGHGK